MYLSNQSLTFGQCLGAALWLDEYPLINTSCFRLIVYRLLHTATHQYCA